MRGKPPEPKGAEEPEVGRPEPKGAEEPEVDPPEAEQPPGATERYGVLAIARHAKDDGRALILYTRLDEDERT
jgi:hypothetical protein